MWQSVSIPLDGSGAGHKSVPTKANLPFWNEGAALLLTKVYIPAQAGWNSGITDCTIAELLPDGLVSGTAILTLTNPTTPFRRPIESLVYDGTGTVTTSYTPETITAVDVAIAQGNANATVTVWLLFL